MSGLGACGILRRFVALCFDAMHRYALIPIDRAAKGSEWIVRLNVIPVSRPLG